MPTQQEIERQIVRRAREKGMNDDQIKQAITKYRENPSSLSQSTSQPEEKGLFGRIGDVSMRAGERFGKRIKGFAEATEQGEQTTGEQIFQTAGALTTGLAEALGGAAFETAKAVAPKFLEQMSADALNKVMSSDEAQAVVGEWSKLINDLNENDPRLARNLLATLEITAGVADLLGSKGAIRGAATGAVRGAEFLGSTARGAKEGILSRAVATQAKARPITDILKGAGEKVGRTISQLPERIEVAGEVAAEASEQFRTATPAARELATSGLDIRTVKKIEDAPPELNKVFTEILDEADKAVKGETARPTPEIAGQQLNKIVSEADNYRKEVGQKLGEVAEGLKLTAPAARQRVLARLREIPGLEKLSINNKGKLVFKGTTLSTSANSSARKRIQQFFDDIKGRDGYGYHQLRQEIFEIQGGRKKAKVELTDTEDKALDAMRKGLADSLETVSDEYKAINQQYAQVAEPMKRLRRFYSGLENASDDILDEYSGILMRRLTGSAVSGPKLRQSLQELQDILKASGRDPGVDLVKLQEFQNVIDKLYPELVKDTSFAGQTALGIRKATKEGLIDKGIDVATKAGQVTPEFQRQKLRELLESIREE